MAVMPEPDPRRGEDMCDVVRLVIEGLDERGHGYAVHNSHRLEFPGALPGETIEILEPAAKPATASAYRIVRPATARIAAACQHFGECGGCSVQHFEHRAYLEWKRRRIDAALLDQEISLGECHVHDWVVAAPGDRRRVDLTFLRLQDNVVLGLNRRASHRIVDLVQCPVLCADIVALFGPLRAFLQAILPSGSSGEVVVNHLDAGLDLLIVLQRSTTPDRRMREMVADFVRTERLLRLAWGDRRHGETLAQRLPPLFAIGPLSIEVPPGAFLQASATAERALQTLVRQWSGGARRVIDLFGGLGTLSLPLLDQARVHVVDGEAAAIAALDRSLRLAAMHGRATVERRDLMRDPCRADELLPFDLAIFDPPRAGAKAQVTQLADSELTRIIGVSCNPVTFARDAAILRGAGFELRELLPIDQFRWSGHIELAGLFLRKRGAARRQAPRPAPHARVRHP